MELLLVAAIGFGIGFLLARLGTWIRIARLEAQIRHLSNELTTHQDFGQRTISVDWVQAQLDQLVRRGFGRY